MNELWATEYLQQQQQKTAGHVGLGDLWHAVAQLGAQRRADAASKQFGMLGTGKQIPAKPGAPIIQARPSAAASTGGGVSPGKSIVPQSAPPPPPPAGSSPAVMAAYQNALKRRGGITPRT